MALTAASKEASGPQGRSDGDCQTIRALKSLGVGMILWHEDDSGLSLSDEAIKLFELERMPKSGMRGVLRLIRGRDERAKLLEALSASKRDQRPLEQAMSVRTLGGRTKWLRIKGGFFPGGASSQFLGILWDETRQHEHEAETERACRESRKLAERLEQSMLETHHRVKNSFQIVSSLLNLELRRKESLARQDVTRVLCYVQGLSLIHDLLTSGSGSASEEASLSAGQLVDGICQSLKHDGISIREEARFRLTPRVASSLAVIATDLIVEALDRGGARRTVQVTLRKPASGLERGELSIERSYSGGDGEGGEGALLDFLARTDLQSEIIRRRSGRQLHISVSFPLSGGRESGRDEAGIAG